MYLKKCDNGLGKMSPKLYTDTFIFEKFYDILGVEMLFYLSHIQFSRYIKIMKVLTRNCPAGCSPVTNPRMSEQHNASAQGPAGCRFPFLPTALSHQRPWPTCHLPAQVVFIPIFLYSRTTPGKSHRIRPST